MEESLIFNKVRKSNRVLFLLCLAGILILFTLLAVFWRYFYNFIRGPFAITTAELSELTDPTTRTEYYVTIKADDIADTGYQRITTYDDGSQEIEATFPVILIGEKILLIETNQTELDASFTGALKPFSDEVKTNVLDVLIADVPELTDYFLPFMLLENNFRLPGIIGLSAGFVLFIGLMIGCLVAVRRMGSPLLPASINNLERFGAVDETLDNIDNEMEANQQQIGDSILTQNWLISSTSSSLDAAKLSEVVWFYKQVTQNRTLGIPTYRSNSIIVFDHQGHQLTLTSTESKTDQLFAELENRCPWAEIGHSEELESLWINDRPAFLEKVSQRLVDVGQTNLSTQISHDEPSSQEE